MDAGELNSLMVAERSGFLLLEVYKAERSNSHMNTLMKFGFSETEVDIALQKYPLLGHLLHLQQ